MNLTKYNFFQNLIRLPYVEYILLYGSRAREDNNERSDMDLAVYCPGASEDDWLEVVNLIEDADTLLKIDCIRLDSMDENNPLRRAILKDGKYLYKRQVSMDLKIEESSKKLSKALNRLESVLQKPIIGSDDTNIDATIQRFEFSIELFWKFLKRIIENLGKEVNFPKEVLREAYAAKMIEDEKLWLKMLENHNKASHTYDEELAYKIYCNIKVYHPVMQRTYNILCEKLRNQ